MEQSGDKKIFDRVEKKCLITEEQKKRLVKVLENYLTKDEYHKSEVFNIYFDTENNDLIQQSIEQPPFKEKLRARSYGGYDKVFLEIKTKLRGKEHNMGYKRRVKLTKKEYDKLMKGEATVAELLTEASKQATETTAGEAKKASKNAKKEVNVCEMADLGRDLQVAKEVDYLIEHFGLKPKFLVTYYRESWVSDKGLRVTFDEKLRYRTEVMKFRKNRVDKNYFDDEKNVIMEIKVQGAWPVWLARLLSGERIFTQRFSKIGKIYGKLRSAEIEEAKKKKGGKKRKSKTTTVEIIK